MIDNAKRGIDAIKSEIGAWLDEHWDPNRSLREWREMLVVDGWAAPAWPKEYFGRGFTAAEVSAVAQAFTEHGAVGAAEVGTGGLAAHTILAHGNDAQKRKYLRPLLTHEHSWCQLFSEPGSGSDLAGLTTKAERAGDRWVINGQKVWNTSAHHADYGLLVARTDWDLPKHQGLSYFLINMRQPGVEARPLKQMNGHASFNEVFLTNAEVAPEDLLGAEGEGWAIAKTTLSRERQGFGRDRSGGAVRNLPGPIYEEYRAELAQALEPYKWYPQRTGRVDLALPRAMQRGALADPGVRQELAKLIAMRKSADLAAASAAQKRRLGERRVSPEGSIGKLAASVIARRAAHVHTLISGADAMLSGPESELEGIVAEILVSVPAISIAGGTDEIQKNIVAERVLGLPKEPRFDTGPFRDIPRNIAEV